MSEIVVPDLIEPLTGWRVWNVTAGSTGRNLALTSLYYFAAWPAGKPVRATCGDHKTHESPSHGCRCGIHATRDLERAVEYMPLKLRRFISEPVPSQPRTRLVFGRVKLWGRVDEYQHGYRAELAQPLEVYVPTAFEQWGIDAPLAARLLADRYEIATHVIRRASDVEVPV